MIALDLAARLGKSPDAAQTLMTMAQSQLEVAAALLPVAATRRDDAFMPILVGIIRSHASLEEALIKTIAGLPYPKPGRDWTYLRTCLRNWSARLTRHEE